MATEGGRTFSIENQHVVAKYLFLEGHSAAQIHRNFVKIFGTNAVVERTVQKWCERFNEGNFVTEDGRTGRSQDDIETEERIAAIEEAFQESRAWTMRSLSAKLQIPVTTCHRLVTNNLKFKKLHKKWIPYELTDSQFETRVNYCKLNLLNYNQQRSRLQRTVAIDESWISLNRPPERDQSKEWRRSGEAASTVAAAKPFGSKRMLILALDFKGVCYYELLAEKETVDGSRYLEFLKRLMDHWRGNRKGTVWLLDDNARPHRTAIVTEWLEQKKIERWVQPSYSPDLSPCDYGCFHALKRSIGGVTYANDQILKEALDKEIRYGNAAGRYTAVQKLPERWEKCIKNKGQFL